MAGPTHVTGSKLGIDFWHAVEFSRSGRASIKPFRAVLEATLLPYQVTLARSKDFASVSHPGRMPPHPENDMIISGYRWGSSGAAPGPAT
jgi:seryl-tRNA synthetase